jgi:hypothetical protein
MEMATVSAVEVWTVLLVLNAREMLARRERERERDKDNWGRTEVGTGEL